MWGDLHTVTNPVPFSISNGSLGAKRLTTLCGKYEINIKNHVYTQAWDQARNQVGDEVALKVRLQITKRIRIEDFTSITTFINVRQQIRQQNEKS